MAADSLPAGALEGGPARPLAAPTDPLFRKLAWLTLFRLVTITVLLGGAAFADLRPAGTAAGPGPLYLLVGFTYAASLGFAVALRARWRLRAVAYAQIALDVLIAAAVVGLTGGAESVFVFLFSLAIVNGSILLFRRGALVGTLLSLASYLTLVTAGSPRPNLLALFVHASAFVTTAALAGYLAEQLQRTGERLAVREEDLAAITALHEAVVQSVASGIVTLDTQGRITFLNRAAEQMTGLRAGAVRGEPAKRWFGAFQAGAVRSEADLDNGRGEVRRIGYDAFPLRGRDARPLGSAIIFQDLTGVRAMELAMKRHERLADLGRIAAGLAHELRNPLASMTGCLELLRGNGALGEEDAHLTEIVLREAARLDQLVSRLLSFTRPEASQRREVDLAQLAGDTLEMFGGDRLSDRVRLDAELSSVRVSCDADQVRQVLWNLLRNATEAATARQGGGGAVVVRVGPRGGAAVIAVEDNGAGIAPSALPHLFTPFFTTKETGTGLGLATVQRIAEAHGGSVGVDAPAGGGARFTFALPLDPGPAQERAWPAS